METRSYLPLLLGLIKPPFNPVPPFQGHEDEGSYLVSQSKGALTSLTLVSPSQEPCHLR